jgi:predicted  nucleic acid-binding Zn-ribbon protein
MDNPELVSEDIGEKLALGGLLPKFGLPTSARYLFHGFDLKEQTPLVIDRDESIAIYEFAPGAQKTKDKRIHKAIGFTSPIFFLGREFRNDESSPFSLHRWMVMCDACGHVHTENDNWNEGLLQECPDCGESDKDSFRKFRIRSPKGYRSDFSEGSDAREDVELALSRPPVFAESTKEGNDLEVANEPGYVITLADRDITWRVNANGWNLFRGTVHAEVKENGLYYLHHQWLLTEKEEDDIASIALATIKKTEVLRISPAAFPDEVNLDMFARSSTTNDAVKAAYYSAAFLLQRIVADELDVDPTEIEITRIVRKSLLSAGRARNVAEIVLADELPNGSGFVRYLFDNFRDIIRKAVMPDLPDSYTGKIHSSRHEAMCQDACYECLKVYRNMNYHGLLDWRLGISLLRLMNDPNFRLGTDGNFEFIELANWRNAAAKLRDVLCHGFGFKARDDFDLPGVSFGRGERNVALVVHPLWNTSSFANEVWLTERFADARAFSNRSGGLLRTIDTFNLQRRMGWCYEKIVSTEF